MLYLEDYLEMIENLPMEMRDRFTEIREMDLEVQNAMDSLDEQVKQFFKKCQTNQALKTDQKNEQFDKIKKGYHKALEDADEKVQLATQIYEMVERYLRKLDHELSKFKMELEADSAGITQKLEKRSLELDQVPTSNATTNHTREKRKHSMASWNSTDRRASETVLAKIAQDAAREFNSTTPVYRSLGDNDVLAEAASKAIGATAIGHQGRRTASLVASYEAVSSNHVDIGEHLKMTTDFKKVNHSSSSHSEKQQTSRQKKNSRALSAAQAVAVPAQKEETADDPSQAGWNVDPNEPRYCVCNEVSYGEMVGCDNNDCPLEWFHYGCVGLTQAPKGKWYCPQCMAAMKRRSRK